MVILVLAFSHVLFQFQSVHDISFTGLPAAYTKLNGMFLSKKKKTNCMLEQINNLAYNHKNKISNIQELEYNYPHLKRALGLQYQRTNVISSSLVKGLY